MRDHRLLRLRSRRGKSVGAASVATLLVTALAVMGSPGPSTISLVACSAAYGVRASLRYCVGLISGTTAVLVAVAFGFTALLLAVPGLRVVLLVAAALYIVWLAVHIAMAPPLERHEPGLRRPGVVEGLLLGVMNPKAWVAIGAVSSSRQMFDQTWVDGIAKTVILTLVIAVIHACWMLVGGLFVNFLRGARRARIVNIAMAVVLIASMGVALLKP